MAAPRRAPLCLLVALVLDTTRAHSGWDVYLPATLELLDAPEYFVHSSSATTRLSTPPWARDLRPSCCYILAQGPATLPGLLPTFTTQQVVPPRATEPLHRPVPWDVRAVSVEATVTPAKPHARVLFHLKGQDWPPGPGSLPCARLYAMHPEGTAHRACRVQPALGACVVELELPAPWFSWGTSSRAALAYTLEPTAEGPGGCAPGGDEDPGQQAFPVDSVELRPEDPHSTRRCLWMRQ